MEIETSGFSPIVTPVMGRPKKAKTPRLEKPKQNSQKNKGIYSLTSTLAGLDNAYAG